MDAGKPGVRYAMNTEQIMTQAEAVMENYSPRRLRLTPTIVSYIENKPMIKYMSKKKKTLHIVIIAYCVFTA